MKKKLFWVFILVFLVIIILLLVKKNNRAVIDSITYKNKEYISLKYNTDIFTYNHYSNTYYEEDIIHVVEHDKWDMVYFDGDLYVHESEIKKATSYYADDKNYDWFIMIEEDDNEKLIPISITEDEREYIYQMDYIRREKTIKFDEIVKFASLVKISKDQTVFSLISLALVEDSWYWKTEIMMDDETEDKEYVIKLPDSLNTKIFNVTR